ncbi:hypothetical protein [Mesorhizobium sp. M4A.F.Ca.ET.022.05.2.1]|uniref:hypothetical protein n=1 Tax=Mesorhizobium sp. M4A.F.Ca.ET.022.05.2.1 TaxID=2496653 RepID=UPI001FDFAC17|nr:hypothetical protein [Mesorhizobium sp. M4A.F.Ca.ET.022.05.2.1]
MAFVIGKSSAAASLAKVGARNQSRLHGVLQQTAIVDYFTQKAMLLIRPQPKRGMMTRFWKAFAAAILLLASTGYFRCG